MLKMNWRVVTSPCLQLRNIRGEQLHSKVEPIIIRTMNKHTLFDTCVPLSVLNVPGMLINTSYWKIFGTNWTYQNILSNCFNLLHLVRIERPSKIEWYVSFSRVTKVAMKVSPYFKNVSTNFLRFFGLVLLRSDSW